MYKTSLFCLSSKQWLESKSIYLLLKHRMKHRIVENTPTHTHTHIENLNTSETKTYYIISVLFSPQALPNSFAFSVLAA